MPADIKIQIDEDSFEEALGRMLELQYIAQDINCKVGRVSSRIIKIYILLIMAFLAGMINGIVWISVLR